MPLNASASMPRPDRWRCWLEAWTGVVQAATGLGLSFLSLVLVVSAVAWVVFMAVTGRLFSVEGVVPPAVMSVSAALQKWVGGALRRKWPLDEG